MKKLSDFEGDEAIRLWGDLLEPIGRVLGDPVIRKIWKDPAFSVMDRAQKILETHSAEVSKALLRIDPTPLNGLNVITRLVSLILEIMNTEELQGFFPSVEPDVMESVSGGFATVSTEDDGK